MTSIAKARRTLSLITALLACCVAVFPLSVRRLSVPEPPLREDANGGADRPVLSGGLAGRVPESTVFLLAADDLGRLFTDLREGPAGKLMAAPSVARFVAALREQPPIGVGEAIGGLSLGAELSSASGGPAGLVIWDLAGERGRSLGLIMRTGPGGAERCLAALGAKLTPVAAAPRPVTAPSGTTLLTLAPPGREGVSWGRCGDWVAAADTLAGCRELLELAAKPRGELHEEIAAALRAAGSGRLSGYFATGALASSRLAGALGLKSIEWVGYSASPLPGGCWSERVIFGGRASGGGLPGGLARGGKRPLLASLPASSFMVLTFNVADGSRLWTEVRKVLGWVDRTGLAVYSLERLAASTGRDFGRDVAPLVKGEVTVGALLPRMAPFPQSLFGVQLVKGGAEKLAPGSENVLRLAYFGGGEPRSAFYGEARFTYLDDQAVVNPFAPSPAYCFLEDRVVGTSQTLHLKEMLSRRGGKWIGGGDDYRRLSSALLGLRISLRRSMPFLLGTAKTFGVLRLLGEKPAANLPIQEELSDHLDDFEAVLDRCPQGMELRMRSPLPAGASFAGALLVLP